MAERSKMIQGTDGTNAGHSPKVSKNYQDKNHSWMNVKVKLQHESTMPFPNKHL